MCISVGSGQIQCTWGVEVGLVCMCPCDTDAVTVHHLKHSVELSVFPPTVQVPLQ